MANLQKLFKIIANLDQLVNRDQDDNSDLAKRFYEFIKFPLVAIRGAGDLATGAIDALLDAGFYVLAIECQKPSAIRREVAFSDAVYYGSKEVESHKAILATMDNYLEVLEQNHLAVLVDEKASCLEEIKPFILIDAIIAKRNLGTNKDMATLTIALGPGFKAGSEKTADVDLVIETMRGHNLGRLIREGEALPNTGVPGLIGGKASERVVYSNCEGKFYAKAKIGTLLEEGEEFAFVIDKNGDKHSIYAPFRGVLRGILPDGFEVRERFKSADIDPRESEITNCFTISDKSRALGNAVLHAIYLLLLEKVDELNIEI